MCLITFTHTAGNNAVLSGLFFDSPTLVSTTTGVSTSTNPATFGQPVTFTATVSDSGGGVPTGGVIFYDGQTELGAGSLLSGSGDSATSTFTTSALAAGSAAIYAVYTPTGLYSGSSASLTQTVTDESAPATTAVTQTTTTGSDGTFDFQNLLPGTYTITEIDPTRLRGCQGHARHRRAAPSATTQFTDIVLGSGVDGTGYDFGWERAPVFTSTPVTTAGAGKNYSYDATATDADGDPLTYSLLEGPSGMTINPTTGQVSLGARHLRRRNVPRRARGQRRPRRIGSADVYPHGQRRKRRPASLLHFAAGRLRHRRHAVSLHGDGNRSQRARADLFGRVGPGGPDDQRRDRRHHLDSDRRRSRHRPRHTQGHRHRQPERNPDLRRRREHSAQRRRLHHQHAGHLRHGQ